MIKELCEMKKNYTVFFAVIAALIALCAFWGCSSSDDDDDGPSLPPAEEAGMGDVEISIAAGEQVYKTDGSEYKPGIAKDVLTPSGDAGDNYADDVIAAGSTITAEGKLTLKLPVFTHWSDADVEVWHTGMEGLTANPSDVKTLHVGSFFISGGSEFGQKNAEHDVSYVYADKDARIQGTSPDGEWTIHAELILKQGWNSIIWTESGSNLYMRTGIPGAGYKWVLADD
jgi:hypothetical protein